MQSAFASILKCVAALGLAAAPAAAFSQETGSLIKPRAADIPDGAKNDMNLARQAMYSFAECALKRSRNATLRYLESFPNSDLASKSAHSLASDECLSDGMMAFNEVAFRGAVYETLYRQQFGRKEPSSFADAGHPDYANGAVIVAVNDQQTVAFREFGDCVARAQPVLVHSLVDSIPGSSTETTTFGALSPSFSGCLTSNVTLKFSKLSLRGVLGEVMYRIRSMPSQVSGVTN